MTETIKLWSRDYKEVLHTTTDRDDATAFFLASGQDWLPIVIDYGTNWHQRWSGRIERQEGGKSTIFNDSEYLEYLITWPNPYV